MADNVNVLLSSFPGLSLPSTVTFSLPSLSTLSDLTEKVTSYLPSSLPFQSLSLTTTNNKQIIPSNDSLWSLLVTDNGESSTLLPLHLNAPLRGGKGGFGSQLRAAGGRMSSKRKRTQGDDNASSRNLDGRRFRTVNEAKALAEYLAVKPEMEQKEKDERRKRWQSIVDASEKRQEELKNGGGRHKIDGQWMEDKEEMNEKAREAVLMAMKGGEWTDNLRDGAAAAVGGSSTSASASEGSDRMGSSSGSDDESEEEAGPSEPNRTSAEPRKFIGFDDDDEFMSDSEEEAEESEGKGKARA